MLDILTGKPKLKLNRRNRANAGLLLALSLLFAVASGAHANQICQDCHGLHHATVEAPQQCGNTTTCGTSCHAGKLDTLMHPSGPGTPIPDPFTTVGIASACGTCHEPVGPGVSHPYRINTSPTTTSPYPDLDQACGQCHGGGTNSFSTPPRTGVVYLSKNQLAIAAPDIHSGHALDNADCTLCHAEFINHPMGGGTPGSGAVACRTCHLTNGILHRNNAISADAVCGQCHGGSLGPGATQNGAMYFSAAVLDAFARDIHKEINPTPPPVAPVVGHGALTIGTTAFTGSTAYSVSFVDTSTFDPNAKTKTVTVYWGDGAVTELVSGATFTHTYPSNRIKSYAVTQTATDTLNPVSRTTFGVSVPQTYTVSGTTVVGAQVSLKLNGLTRQSVTATDGAFSFSNLLPGSYTIRVYKSGFSFTDYRLDNLSANISGINIPAN